jgi:hypothetical protein
VFGGQIREYLNRAHVLRRAFTSLPPSSLSDESRPVEERPWEPSVAAAAPEEERERYEGAYVQPGAPVLLPPSDLLRDLAPPLDLFQAEEPPPTLEEPQPLVVPEDPAPAETPWAEPLVTDIDALSAELDEVLAAHASMPPPEAPATVRLEAPAVEQPEIEEPEADVPVEGRFRTDLLELLAAIQLDLEPLRSAPEVRPVARVKPPAGRIEDEWGFFDPEQCGMAALLARLDDMARQRDTSSAPD